MFSNFKKASIYASSESKYKMRYSLLAISICTGCSVKLLLSETLFVDVCWFVLLCELFLMNLVSSAILEDTWEKTDALSRLAYVFAMVISSSIYDK